jgi:hypothetical protein
MQQVLKYLRAEGYKTYIVTGGGQDLVRTYSEATYGIPPEQVVGTAGGTKYGSSSIRGNARQLALIHRNDMCCYPS